MKSNTLTAINFLIVLFFLLTFIVYKFDLRNPVLDGVSELLTIPFLLAQIVFLVIGIRFLIANREKNLLNIFSLILLAACFTLTVGDIILSFINN